MKKIIRKYSEKYSENNPKRCDMGMAKFIGGGNQTVQQGNGGGMDTPGYMPPEVIMLKKGQRYEPKYWDDVFSMAMIILLHVDGKNIHYWKNLKKRL